MNVPPRRRARSDLRMMWLGAGALACLLVFAALALQLLAA